MCEVCHFDSLCLLEGSRDPLMVHHHHPDLLAFFHTYHVPILYHRPSVLLRFMYPLFQWEALRCQRTMGTGRCDTPVVLMIDISLMNG